MRFIRRAGVDIALVSRRRSIPSRMVGSQGCLRLRLTRVISAKGPRDLVS